MTWENTIKKAPRLSRTTDLFGGGPDKISDVDTSVEGFWNVFVNNRKAAYERSNFTDEEIKVVEKEYEKVIQAKEDFKEFLKTLWQKGSII